MNESEIHALETLQNKPTITNKPIVKINFREQRGEPILEEQEGKAEPRGLKIVNKRKGPDYREMIFERLNKNKVNTGYAEVTLQLKPAMKKPVEEKVNTNEPHKKHERILITKPEVESKHKIEEIVEEDENIENIENIEQEEENIEQEEENIVENIEQEEENIVENIEQAKDEMEKREDDEIEELKQYIKETEVIIAPKEKAKRGRKPKKTGEKEEYVPVDLTTALIETTKVVDRLPKEKERKIITTSAYYMNNRKIYIQKIAELFKNYRELLSKNEDTISCDSRSQNDEFDLLTHQRIVRDYLNLYTPYRGLLLYHGLGSGKTCTSIAIAEGMKTNKRVYVLTPASLKMNFFSEMKKCGDQLYKKNQYWDFVSIEGKPDYIPVLSKALSLSTEYIKMKKGAWLVNVNKPSNYTDLSSEEQLTLDEQLNEMIRTKYTDINYNGLNMKKINLLTGDLTHNPFDNSVVVIDEAHNFVSRIVNKVKNKKPTIATILYDYLMSAKNARIVLLSGTPIINYPNEIGILFNILRGYIKTWAFTINVKTSEKITTDTILEIFDKENLRTYDFVEYNGNVLSVTRNPYGFINTKKRGAVKGTKKNVGGKGTKKTVTKTKKTNTKKVKIEKDIKPMVLEDVDHISEHNYRVPQDLYEGGGPAFDKYNGVKLDDTGNISDEDFQNRILFILNKHNLEVQKGSIKVYNYKALPDDPESFLATFVDSEKGESKNINLFQKRILGLTSYFRSAQEQLLPSFVKTESGENYHIEKTEMSTHQFGIYEKIRKEEADRESKTKKRQLAAANKEDDLYKISSTYRIFSRAACNFAFPTSIERPVPNVKEDKDINENIFDAVPTGRQQLEDEYANISEEENKEDEDAVVNNAEELRYEKRIEKALEDISVIDEETHKSKYLSKEALSNYSPKFARLLENLMNEENIGLHLMYSHFRTIEGIGIMRLILMANGFAEFKIQKTDDQWDIIENEEDADKPKFVLYTGTETAEEKEIIRNAYNGAWEFVPSSIATKLKSKAENNNLGEVIKIFMITSSGAEGINLKNTRFVHIVEPYWHMVRVEQVVGRARRICSHQDLPEELRTVKVFLYITTLSEQQKTDDKNVELRIRDLSRIDHKTPVTTDETLFEIAFMKQKINNQILKAVKETAIDCQLYSNISKKKEGDDKLVCYGFGKIESNQFSSYPSFENDRSSKEGLDVETVKWTAVKITENGVDYALNEKTMEVYDFESYQRAKEFGSDLILIGKLVKDKGKYKIMKE